MSHQFMSYEESQRRRICPFCIDQKSGKRAEEQNPVSLYALYICPDGHHYHIDECCGQSEVAAIREQIEQQCQAMRPRFEKYASHEDINRRYRNLGNLRVRLTEIVGEDEALSIVGQSYVDAQQEHAD